MFCLQLCLLRLVQEQVPTFELPVLDCLLEMVLAWVRQQRPLPPLQEVLTALKHMPLLVAENCSFDRWHRLGALACWQHSVLGDSECRRPPRDCHSASRSLAVGQANPHLWMVLMLIPMMMRTTMATISDVP